MKLKQICIQGIGLAGRKGFLALSFLAIARVLGPGAFGDYSYAYTWVYFATLVAALGTAPVTTREIAFNQNAAPRILGTVARFRLVSSTIAAIVVIAFALRGDGSAVSVAVMLLAITIPPASIVDQLGAYVMGFADNKQFAIVNVVAYGAFALFTVAALVRSPRLTSVIWAQDLALWLAGIVLLVALRRHVKAAARAAVSARAVRQILVMTLPVAVTNCLAILYFRVGTLALFHYQGDRATGIFSSSLQIIEGLQLVPMAVIGASFPVICKSVEDLGAFSGHLRKALSLLLYLGLFFAATVSVLAASVVAAVLGRQYEPAAAVLRWLAWATVPMFLHYALAYFLIARGNQAVMALNAFIGVLVSVAGNMLLIPRYGLMGACYAALATEMAIFALHLAFVVLPMRQLWSVLPRIVFWPVAATVFVIVATYFWRVPPTWFGAAIYVLFSSAVFVVIYTLRDRGRPVAAETAARSGA